MLAQQSTPDLLRLVLVLEQQLVVVVVVVVMDLVLGVVLMRSFRFECLQNVSQELFRFDH